MTTSLTTADGIALHLHEWPASTPQAGTVLIVHGLGEHIMRYAHVARYLNEAGWRVVGHDHRGHGQSSGPRGRLTAADDLLRDLSRVIDAVRPSAPAPLVLLGHSLGGLIAARFVAEGLSSAAAEWYRPVDALVLSSPAIDPGMNAAQKLLLAVMHRIAPDLAVSNGLKPEWISRDAAVVRAYEADPLVHDRVTARLVEFILAGASVVLQRAPHWQVPTLLLYAGSDRCVAPRGSAAFADAAPPGVVETHVFPDLFHEIFNEPEKQQVLSLLVAWLATRRR